MKNLTKKEIALLGEVIDLMEVNPDTIYSCSSLELSLKEIKRILKKFERLGLIKLEIKYDKYYKKDFWTGKIKEKAKKAYNKLNEKPKISGIFNNKDENYFKIKIEDIKSEKYIHWLIRLLDDLGISHHLNAEPQILSAKYKGWIERHEFFRKRDYVIHIIFTKEYMYLIVKCSLKKRKEFLKFLK